MDLRKKPLPMQTCCSFLHKPLLPGCPCPKQSEKPFGEEKELKARPQCRAGLGFPRQGSRPGCATGLGCAWRGREFGRMFMLGHLLFPWVCGNKSWIKQPQPARWGSAWDVDYPGREPRGRTPTAFNRRQGKTSRDPLGKRQERLPGSRWNGYGNCWPLPTRLGKVTAGAGGLGRICCLRAVLKNGKMLPSTDTSSGKSTRVI